jgi:hypothetical protein
MKTYQLSPNGRRTTIILLIAALAIWAFAIWSFQNTLQITYDPRFFWGSLKDSMAQGLSINQIVPSLLMLVLIVATPLLVWNLLEEWSASYTPTEAGLRFDALFGITITYPWEAIGAVRRVDDDRDEPVDELIITSNQSHQIANPLLRFLHAQAYGGTRLPIYAGLEARDELLDEIRQRAALNDTDGMGERDGLGEPIRGGQE